MLTRSFPPLSGVGGVRAFRFAKHLPAHGWEPIIASAPIPAGAKLDRSMQCGARVERIYCPLWWPQPHVKYTGGRHPIGAERARIVTGLFEPPLGSDAWLSPYVVPRVAAFCRSHRIDLIFATSGPPAVLLHGLLAARWADVGVVFDLRDPWSLNYLQDRKSPLTRRLERWLEPRLLAAADRVVFASRTTRQEYLRAFAGVDPERTKSLYTGYDGEPYSLPPPLSGPVTLIHFGNCFGARTLEPILRAIATVRGVRLVNMGRVQASDLRLARSLGIEDALEVCEGVEHAQGMDRLASADMLVLLGYGDHAGFVPAKTFDYFRVGRPILCISRCAELRDLIEGTHTGVVISPDDPRAIAAHIATARRPSSAMSAGAVQPYDSRVSAARLASLMDDVVRERADQ